MKSDTLLWVGVGGAALVGGYLYLRRPAQAYAGPVVGAGALDGLMGQIDSLFALPQSRGAQPVSGPGPYTAQAGPVGNARIPNQGPTATDISIKSGFAVGTGAAVGALGPGSVLAGAATAGIGAAVGVLAWAIGTKGLFRGGEEAMVVNPARDRYLEWFGPPGTGPDSGFGILAARLTEITHEPNGSQYFRALNLADTKKELIKATLDIQGVFASAGIQVPAFVE